MWAQSGVTCTGYLLGVDLASVLRKDASFVIPLIVAWHLLSYLPWLADSHKELNVQREK